MKRAYKGRTKAMLLRAAEVRQAIISVLHGAPRALSVADIAATTQFQATKYPRANLAPQLRTMAENNLIRRTSKGDYLPPKTTVGAPPPPVRRPLRAPAITQIAGPLTLNVDLLKQVDRCIRLEINGLAIEVRMLT
jgi:hypothetical protein